MKRGGVFLGSSVTVYLGLGWVGIWTGWEFGLLRKG